MDFLSACLAASTQNVLLENSIIISALGATTERLY